MKYRYAAFALLIYLLCIALYSKSQHIWCYILSDVWVIVYVVVLWQFTLLGFLARIRHRCLRVKTNFGRNSDNESHQSNQINQNWGNTLWVRLSQGKSDFLLELFAAGTQVDFFFLCVRSATALSLIGQDWAPCDLTTPWPASPVIALQTIWNLSHP